MTLQRFRHGASLFAGWWGDKAAVAAGLNHRASSCCLVSVRLHPWEQGGNLFRKDFLIRAVIALNRDSFLFFLNLHLQTLQWNFFFVENVASKICAAFPQRHQRADPVPGSVCTLRAPPSEWASPTSAKETLSNFMPFFFSSFYLHSSPVWSELQTVQGLLFVGVKFYYWAAQNARLHCDVKSGHNTNPVSAAQNMNKFLFDRLWPCRFNNSRMKECSHVESRRV